MRGKKILSSFLAGAIIFTSVFTGDEFLTRAADEPTPVASYHFDGTLGDASAVITGLGAWSGSITYDTGRTGESGDSAVKLGDYGLHLNQTNLGSDYSISMWVKPSGTIATNSPVLFLGYHSPEKWVAVSGYNNTNNCKIWTNDGSTYKWASLTSGAVLAKDTWSNLTLTQSGNTLSAYINGVLVASGGAAEALNGTNQSIYLGVSNWDAEFVGCMDDVQIYDETLTPSEVRYLYDGATDETVFAAEGFTATESLSMYPGFTQKVSVTLPSTITTAVISYESDDTSVATVDANGTVTGVKAGTAKITTTVAVGGTVKTAATTVTVQDDSGINQDLAVEYDLSKAVDGKLVDTSGHGNDATIHNPDYVTFTTEDGKSVMNITNTSSYLDLPIGIMDALPDKEKFTIEATYSRSSSAGGTSWLFCIGSNPKTTGTNYLFYCPLFGFGGNEVRAGIKNNSTEQLFSTGIVNENEKFYTIDMVFDEGTVKLYIDGVKVGGELQSGYSIVDDIITNGCKNNILGYIGKSCWSQDTNFVGKISGFRVYSSALNDEEVQLSDPAYQEALLAKVSENLTETDILGSKNTSASAVRYNLALPDTFDEMDVSWVSDHPEIISNDGLVLNKSTDQTVNLTATVTSGALAATKSFPLTVKALDKTALNNALSAAKTAYASTNYTEDSRAALKKAMEKADSANNQTTVDSVTTAITKAVKNLEYNAAYKDPFSYIDETKLVTNKALSVNEKATLFTVPSEIKNMVTISYSSSNTAVASYQEGVVTGLKAGYSRVTVTVTSKYDGFAMEYQTLVQVDLDLSKVTAKAAASQIANGKTTSITVSYPTAVKNAKPSVTYTAAGAVSVSSAGKVTAKKAGTGTVTVKIKAGGKSITKNITIKVGDISGSSSVKAKKSTTLKVTGITGTVKWSVNKKSIATINTKGKLTAKKKGTVIVTAKVGSVTMTKKITVK